MRILEYISHPVATYHRLHSSEERRRDLADMWRSYAGGYEANMMSHLKIDLSYWTWRHTARRVRKAAEIVERDLF